MNEQTYKKTKRFQCWSWQIWLIFFSCYSFALFTCCCGDERIRNDWSERKNCRTILDTHKAVWILPLVLSLWKSFRGRPNGFSFSFFLLLKILLIKRISFYLLLTHYDKTSVSRLNRNNNKQPLTASVCFVVANRRNVNICILQQTVHG